MCYNRYRNKREGKTAMARYTEEQVREAYEAYLDEFELELGGVQEPMTYAEFLQAQKDYDYYSCDAYLRW